MTTTFGEYIKQLRLNENLSLREFCLRNGYDPGNHSKLERGKMTPAQDKATLTKMAYALNLKEDTEEWMEFFTLARLSNNLIPYQILSDSQAVENLPLFFRTLAKEKVPGEKLRELIEYINKA